MKTNLKVLIVDDDPLALEVAAAVLEGHGYAVIKREEALGTMMVVRRERPDVVLLDLHMPGLSGDALTKLIVGSKDTTDPIIVLHSAAEPSQLEQLSNSCGAAGWIEKTSDPRAFLMRFTQIVAKRAERRSRQTLPRSRAGERTHT